VQRLEREFDSLPADDDSLPEDANGDVSVNADETLADIQIELTDILENYTPPFSYLGSLEGDGACLGVWPDAEVLTGDGNVNGEDVPRLPAGTYPAVSSVAPRSALPRFFLAVSDHGNATLYRRRDAGRSWRWVEVWSVV